MYLRSDAETRLGQPAPQVFNCSVNSIILDDFQVGDYRLRPSHYEKLMAIQDLANVMKNAGRPLSVSLTGFTDSSGKERMNRGLALNRAAEVQSFLVRVGVSVHSVGGMGESNPRASNTTEAGRRKNRRVELNVCFPVLSLPPSGGQASAPRAGAPVGRRLGDAPSYTPWRVRLGLRPKPQYLRFLNLDQFNWNEASLTPPLRQMVGHLAKHVQLSWKSMQPIGFIRLTGHTDNTGKHDYNVDLGNRRARAVKEALENLLKEDILKRRIAILVEESPGELKWIADNRTPKGRALNRRVEVFVAPPEPPSKPVKKPIVKPPQPPQPPVIQTTPGPYPWGKPPTLPPGKTFKQWVDEWLGDHVGKWLREKIWDAIFHKNFGLVSTLLNTAGISGPEKDAFLGTVRVLAETQAR